VHDFNTFNPCTAQPHIPAVAVVAVSSANFQPAAAAASREDAVAADEGGGGVTHSKEAGKGVPQAQAGEGRAVETKAATEDEEL
jgi:hypothetical protein